MSAYEDEVATLLTEKFASSAARFKVNVTEAYNLTGDPFAEGANKLVVVVKIFGLDADDLMVAIALDADDIEDVTKTPQEVAQLAYAAASDALEQRGVAHD